MLSSDIAAMIVPYTGLAERSFVAAEQTRAHRLQQIREQWRRQVRVLSDCPGGTIAHQPPNLLRGIGDAVGIAAVHDDRRDFGVHLQEFREPHLGGGSDLLLGFVARRRGSAR